MWWSQWSKEDEKRIKELSPQARFGIIVVMLVLGAVTVALCVAFLA